MNQKIPWKRGNFERNKILFRIELRDASDPRLLGNIRIANIGIRNTPDIILTLFIPNRDSIKQSIQSFLKTLKFKQPATILIISSLLARIPFKTPVVFLISLESKRIIVRLADRLIVIRVKWRLSEHNSKNQSRRNSFFVRGIDISVKKLRVRAEHAVLAFLAYLMVQWCLFFFSVVQRGE